MIKQFAFCERCHAKLNADNMYWLELDQRTGTYSDKEVPEEFSQGGFPFGKDCAKLMIAEHEAATLILLTPVIGTVQDNTIAWTGKEPPTMTTIWNDDDPHGVELKPKPAPQQTGTG